MPNAKDLRLTKRKYKYIFEICTTYNNKLNKFIKYFDIIKMLRYIIQEKLQQLSFVGQCIRKKRKKMNTPEVTLLE